MPKRLKLYVFGLVTAGVVALAVASLLSFRRTDWPLGIRPAIALPFGSDSEAAVITGLVFWTMLTLAASALPVRMPRGTQVAVGIAPMVAVLYLGGPLAAGLVAAVGTTEIRELRGRVPWYGSLANHAAVVLPLVVGCIVTELLRAPSRDDVRDFVAAAIGSGIFVAGNVVITTTMLAVRSGESLRVVAVGDAKGFAGNLIGLVPIGLLMGRLYETPSGWWSTLLLALPLYTTRIANRQFVEMREMFTQTISSLAQAVDKKDPYTSGHSLRVKEIAVDIGREMRVGDQELEALEWGGLLHDVGKIGVPDAVLLKQERLTREERMIMNAHPVLGAEIIAPVTKLAPELPIIRHHHEWYNGSGYPDRLMGDEIPKLARILHVADAFEAMTAARPYRMKPLSAEQALGELRKFAGIQFDPAVVDAFVKTKWVDGVPDAGRDVQPRPVPMISQAALRVTQAAALPDSPVAKPDLH